MAKYRVYVNFSGYTVREVEAASPEEAEEIALKSVDIPDDCEDWNGEVGSIHLIHF